MFAVIVIPPNRGAQACAALRFYYKANVNRLQAQPAIEGEMKVKIHAFT
jgi:hypothetical protein